MDFSKEIQKIVDILINESLRAIEMDKKINEILVEIYDEGYQDGQQEEYI